MQYIQLQSQIAANVALPTSGSLNLFVDNEDNFVKVVDSEGNVYGSTGGGYTEITYSGLVETIATSGLTVGAFYLITDFRTCYDQPDFDYNNNPITEDNYKQSAVEPILVFATSTSAIDSSAYQSAYPNDRIQYDWTFNETEGTNSTAFGRITERIDEFNNRTDYDHRTILFKRYRLFTFREGLRLNGTIALSNDGTVEGTNTSFESLSVGDVIYVPSVSPSYYEITSIDDDVNMTVSGDTIVTGGGLQFYKAIEEDADGNGYFSYKRTNVKTNDFIEYTTFGDAISQAYAKNNYVGNFANIYTNQEFTFLLANNVFLNEEHSSNKFGNYCYNNTFGADNSNNVWGDWCYQNVSTNDIDDNIIGHYFHDNLINDNLTSNHIDNYFNNNRLLAENEEAFEDNIIGNGFNNNIIYSRFYKNEILDNFNDNVIGDFGNLTEFEFYRNYIRNNFNENIIRQDFQNNQIGTNFQENEINGEFQGNTILNGYNNNTIGSDFQVNNIGNGFNNNTVYDNFGNNSTDYYFYDNIISSDFYNNSIGTYFENNKPTNSDLFGWDDLSTVSTRNYELFYDAINTDLNNKILGKELVMKIISTSQYFKIKFTQWTQGANGGGFQYERQELDSNGNPADPSIIFTKTNYGSEVDIIVEGVVEITRGDSNGIYNIATEGSWNSSVSPQDTEWNSIYTQTNNGNNFRNNVIGNNFEDNTIGSYFGYDDDDDGQEKGNKIGDNFRNNTIVSTMYGNVIGNDFIENSISANTQNNVIGNQFENNTILDEFADNEFGNQIKGNLMLGVFLSNKVDSYVAGNQFSGDTIANNIGSATYDNDFLGDVYTNSWGGGFYGNVIGGDFQNNQIGHYFNDNTINNNFGFGYDDPQGNKIGNKIGNNFYNNIVNEYFYNNSIPDNFKNNTIGKYFQWNVVNTEVKDIDFTVNYGNITGFTYVATGNGAADDTYSSIPICGTTIFDGTNATFDVVVASGVVDSVNQNSAGRGYSTGTTLTILGTQIGGTTPNDDIVITITGVTGNQPAYEHYTTQIFERRGGDKRISFYDENDVLEIDSIIPGYIVVYSNVVSFSINNTSFEFECDGSSVGSSYYGSEFVGSMSDLVSLFNNWGVANQFGFYFDNGDGRLGLYTPQSTKDALCPTGVLTLNVFND
jgi:hypothetical protein